MRSAHVEGFPLFTLLCAHSIMCVPSAARSRCHPFQECHEHSASDHPGCCCGRHHVVHRRVSTPDVHLVPMRFLYTNVGRGGMGQPLGMGRRQQSDLSDLMRLLVHAACKSAWHATRNCNRHGHACARAPPRRSARTHAPLRRVCANRHACCGMTWRRRLAHTSMHAVQDWQGAMRVWVGKVLAWRVDFCLPRLNPRH